jgi:predicted amidohydrolase
MRIALANLRFPSSPDDSIALVENAIAEAGRAGAAVICFPECYVPGYRGVGTVVPPPDEAFLDRAWSAVSRAAKHANVAVILGTERIVDGALRATALVIGADGERMGFQDKVQLDPSEDETYSPGSEREVFEVADA